jgi:NAD(P)-dependent dehydrogenase (short-subunit alcohol dehydrogenase family)
VGRLDGRVAIVTGASRGLGRDVALALAAEGAAVAAVARTEAEGQSRIPGTLADTVAAIEERGGRAIALRADVSREEEIAAAVQHTVEAFGRLDILVNNAGILIPGTIREMQVKHWELALRVNLTGPFLACRAALPYLTANGGHVINVSSRGAIGPGPGPYEAPSNGGTSYGTTKAALERFTQGLASEVFGDRVSVNALSPTAPIWSEGGHFFRQASGEPDYSGWRKSGAIFADAAVLICLQEQGVFTGRILYDEGVVEEQGGLSHEQMLARYPIEP